LIMVFSIITAYLHKQSILNRTEGIIVRKEVDIKKSPMETAKTNFELHEGTKVQLRETNKEWIHIEVNGNTGWVLKEDLWEI